MSVVTRFPPSPTGFMHIGSARTALFNWLYAKRQGGKMLFRIEDTDRARHSEEAVTALINAMHWLEMDWEGDIVSQFERRERHAEVAWQLLKEEKAYKCYYTPEELEQIKKEAGGHRLPRYTDLEKLEKSGRYKPSQKEKFTIRIKSPLTGFSKFDDEVYGPMEIRNSEALDDFIILRSDGTPTYMLAVVVDDHDMGVTHVIRGDDHLNNTFRQNTIYDAMGWERPVYAHVPLILGPDGTKMSKRHGAASVEEYRDMGYLSEAMRNYLLRLGWSHGDEEIISTPQAIEWFDLEHIGRSPARFDFEKLESLNSHYIESGDPDYIFEAARPFYKARHSIEVNETGRKRILAHTAELQSRAKTLIQYADESAFYAKELPLDYDDKARTLLEDSADVLKALQEAFKTLEPFTGAAVQKACKDIARDLREGKMGKTAMPLRAALTGTMVSPSIFQAAEILGREETCARIRSALETVQ